MTGRVCALLVIVQINSNKERTGLIRMVLSHEIIPPLLQAGNNDVKKDLFNPRPVLAAFDTVHSHFAYPEFACELLNGHTAGFAVEGGFYFFNLCGG